MSGAGKSARSSPEVIGFSPSQLAEVRRIAAELLKIYRTGLITGAEDPALLTYAAALRMFKATVAQVDRKEL
jgi:hypothetical protein